jgi:hypothetical protein
MVICVRRRTARSRCRIDAPRERSTNVSSATSSNVVPNRAGRMAGTRAAMDSTTAAYCRKFLVDAAGLRLMPPATAMTPSNGIARSRSPPTPVSL